MHRQSKKIVTVSLITASLLLLISIVVIAHIVYSAFNNDNSAAIDSYPLVNYLVALGLGGLLVLIVFLIKVLTKYIAIYSEAMPESSKKYLGYAIRLLSSMPTPLIASPLFIAYFQGFGSGFLYGFILLLIIICALPTAFQIGIDAFSQHPREIEQASLALGLDKIYGLYKICAGSFSKAFTTAAIIGVMRVLFENWAISLHLAGDIAELPVLMNQQDLAQALMDAYQNITAKLNWITIVILILLALLGRVWFSIAAFMGRGS